MTTIEEPARILVVDDEPDLELLIRQRFRHKIRNNEVTFDFADVLSKTSTAKPTVLPVPCRVTQCGCTAVEKSRESVPAAGSLFLLRQKK